MTTPTTTDDGELRTRLTEAELEQLRTQGYVIVDRFYSPAALEAAAADVAAQVEMLAQALHRAGRLSDLHAAAPFDQRLTLIERECPGASTLLHQRAQMLPAIQRLWAEPRVLDMVQQVVGPDIAGHPIWNIRCKTPEAASKNHATVPWHQDLGYLLEGDAPYQLTAWVPLVAATRANGCMEVLRGPYFPERRVLPHEGCWRNTWYLTIADGAFAAAGIDVERDTVLCEVPVGSVLLLDNYIPHRSLPNTSEGIRWSFDLRWQDPKFDPGCRAQPVLMRTAANPEHVIDWASAGPAKPADWSGELVPVIGGPWMDRWPMVNVNEHVKAWRDGATDLSRHPRNTPSAV